MLINWKDIPSRNSLSAVEKALRRRLLEKYQLPRLHIMIDWVVINEVWKLQRYTHDPTPTPYGVNKQSVCTADRAIRRLGGASRILLC